jgi:hypothetical protein
MNVLVLAAALGAKAASASADIITIEPDDFAPGTDVTHAIPGVTLWTITAQDPLSLLYTPTYVRQNPECLTGPCDAVTGSQGFSPNPGGYGSLYGEYDISNYVSRCVLDVYTGAFSGGGGFAPCTENAGMSALWMEFDTPTDFVEIAGVWTSDPLWVAAYDESYNLLDVQALPDVILPRNAVGFTTGFSDVTAPAGNIRYVIAGSVGGLVGLDQIRYQAVPEPSTLLLCGVGFVGLLRHRRSSRRH